MSGGPGREWGWQFRDETGERVNLEQWVYAVPFGGSRDWYVARPSPIGFGWQCLLRLHSGPACFVEGGRSWQAGTAFEDASEAVGTLASFLRWEPVNGLAEDLMKAYQRPGVVIRPLA